MSGPSPALELAAQVRAGAESAEAVLERHLSVIDERDDEIHAFNLVMVDAAREQAAATDAAVESGEDPGPLAGVPVAVKDNMCTRGVPTTCSSRILEGWRPPYDATVVAPLDFARLPIVAVVGMLFYDEPLVALTFLGAIVIFGANYLNIRAEQKRRA